MVQSLKQKLDQDRIILDEKTLEESQIIEILSKFEKVGKKHLGRNLKLLYNSIELMDSWSERVLLKIRNLDDSKFEDENYKLTDYQIINGLFFYEEISIMTKESFLQVNLEKYCMENNKKVDFQSLEKVEVFTTITENIQKYYDVNKQSAELDVQEICRGLINKLKENKNKCNTSEFFKDKEYSIMISNFIGLIYLYHQKMIDFIQKKDNNLVMLIE